MPEENEARPREVASNPEPAQAPADSRELGREAGATKPSFLGKLRRLLFYLGIAEIIVGSLWILLKGLRPALYYAPIPFMIATGIFIVASALNPIEAWWKERCHGAAAERKKEDQE